MAASSSGATLRVLVMMAAGIVSLSGSCSDSAQTERARVATLHQAVELDTWPAQVVVALNSLWLRDGSVTAGDVVAVDASGGPVLSDAAEAVIGIGAVLKGSVVANRIRLKANASVNGSASFNELVNNGTIAGALQSPLSLPVPVQLPQFPAFAAGTENVTLENSEDRDLAPGGYGVVKLKQGTNADPTTLRLLGGTYDLLDLDVGEDTRVECVATCEVRIKGKLRPGEDSYIGPSAGSTLGAEHVQIFVEGVNGTSGNLGATPKAAEIGLAATVRALMYVPNGTLLIKQNSDVEGTFVARDVHVGISVEVRRPATAGSTLAWGAAGTGPGQLDTPTSIAVDRDGHVYVGDKSDRVQRFTTTGAFLGGWGTAGAGAGQFADPPGLAIGFLPAGGVLLADAGNHRIQRFSGDGVFQAAWGTPGNGDGEFAGPTAVAVNSMTGAVYVLDAGNGRVQEFDARGAFKVAWGSVGPGASQFHGTPAGLGVDSRTGSVYVGDPASGRVLKFTATGEFAAAWGALGSGDGEQDAVAALAVDTAGSVHVLDPVNARVQVYSESGALLGRYGRSGSSSGELSNPSAIAIDSRGNVFVADAGNDRVQIFRVPSPAAAEPPVVVAAGASLDVAPGMYGAFIVGDAATLRVGEGAYDLGDVTLGVGARLEFTAQAELRIAGRLVLAQDTFVGPAPGSDLTAEDVRIAVLGSDGTAESTTATSVEIGQGSDVTGLVYVPYGTTRLSVDAVFTGYLATRVLDADDEATINQSADIVSWLTGFDALTKYCPADTCAAADTACVFSVDPCCGRCMTTHGDFQLVSSFAAPSCVAVLSSGPCSDGEVCTTDDACDEVMGSCIGTPVPEGGACPGDNGQPCEGDEDCEAPLVCGFGNGFAFRSASPDVCWSPECEVSFDAICGAGSICGACEPRSRCFVDGDCEAGEVCGRGNGILFASPDAGDVCWSASCESDQVGTGCGSVDEPCGVCRCEPECEGKVCGGDLSNGCGGTCRGVCDDRAPGCTGDADCAPGSKCGLGAGQRVGLFDLDGPVNVCLPAECFDHDVKRIPNCGMPLDVCGTCPPCTPSCDARECGDDQCGGECGQGCGDDEDCVVGQCTERVLARILSVPDGDGGTRDVPPLTPPPSSGVGAMAGTFGVTDRGAASYTVPIIVPPGRAALIPELSLRYLSTKENGILGVGWSLDGLSTIARCQRTHAQDGFTQPTRFDSSDAFCLDGQRLVAVSGAYGGDGTEYRTEIDTFSRVISRGGSLFAGPDSFDVFTKDGRVLRYGTTADARILADAPNGTKRGWALSRAEDRSGNYITVRYLAFQPDPATCRGVAGDGSCSTAEIVPWQIAYGGNSVVGTTPNRHVGFVYSSDRPDRLDGFTQGGAQIARTRRLETIQTTVNGEFVRRYKLAYESGDTGRSRVATIQECGFDGGLEVCMPATRFSYRDEDGGFTGRLPTGLFPIRPRVDPEGSCPADDVKATRLVVLDLNGDGLDDFVAEPNPTADVWRAYISTGSVDAPFEVRSTGVRNQAPTSVPAADKVFEFTGVLDFDEDGRDDLYAPRHGVYTSSSSTPGSLDGPFGHPPLGPGLFPADVKVKAWFSLFDVDGDGLEDIYRCEARAAGGGYSDRYYRGLGGGFATSGTPLPSFGNCAITAFTLHDRPVLKENRLVVDHDGDGVPDLLRYDTTHGGWARLERPTAPPDLGFWDERVFFMPEFTVALGVFHPIDFNGDGLPDYSEQPVTFSHSGGRTYYSIESTSERVNAGGPLRGRLDSGEIQLEYSFKRNIVVDWNGDEFRDVLRISDFAPGTGLGVHFASRLGSASGLGHSTGNVESEDFDLPYPRCGGQPVAPLYVAHPADVNGDGNKDVLVVEGNGELVVYYRNGARADLLTRVVDGLGKRIDIDYDPHGPFARTYAPGAVFGADCVYPQTCVKQPGPLVSHHAEGGEDEAGELRAERHFDYVYANAKADRKGRGWLGFARRAIFESDGARVLLETTELEFDNATLYNVAPLGDLDPGAVYPFAGRILSSQVQSAVAEASLNDTPTSRVEERTNTWEVRLSDAGRPFPFLTRQVITAREIPTALPPDAPETELVRVVDDFGADQYGNVVASARNVLRVSGSTGQLLEQRETTSAFIPTPSEVQDWLISLPKGTTVTESRNGNTQEVTHEMTYDSLGRLQQVIREPGNFDLQTITNLPRDAFGNIDYVETIGGLARRFVDITYDERGIFPLTLENSKGHRTEISSNLRHGLVDGLADVNGIPVQRAFDAFGRLRREVGPVTDLTVAYVAPAAPDGRMAVTAVDVGRSHTRTEVDFMERPVRQELEGYDGATVLQELAYDVAGRLSSVSRPHLPGDSSQGDVTFEYDARQRLRRTSYPDGAVVQRLYATVDTASGLSVFFNQPEALTLVETIDPNGHFDVAVLDHRNAIVRNIDGKFGLSDYEYGANGVLQRIVQHQGVATHTTHRIHDILGRLDTVHDPDRGTTSITYTNLDEVATLTRNARTSSMFYDELGRLELYTTPVGPHEWVYDGLGPNETGRLVETIHPDGNRARYTYEPPEAARNRGLVAEVARTIAGVTLPTRIDYTDAGLPAEVHYPASLPFSVRYTYDGVGNARTASTVELGVETEVWRFLEADQGFRVKREQQGGVDVTRAYEPGTGRTSSITTRRGPTVLQSLGYGYDLAGNVTVRTGLDLPGVLSSQAYTYDELDRIRSVSSGDLELSAFDYDELGNLKSKSDVGTYAYSPARPHAVDAAGGNTFDYDADGNQTLRDGADIAGGHQLLDYDFFGQPTTITTGSGAAAEIATLEYDTGGLRVAERAPSTTTLYAEGIYEHLHVNMSDGNGEERFRVFVQGRQIAEVTRSSVGGFVVATDRREIIADLLGSPTLLTDAAGNEIHRQDFDPFGQSSSATAETPTNFTGHRLDAARGLVNAGYRLYDPKLGGWLTPDPITSAPFRTQGLNPYSYVSNNPLGFVDPMGLEGELSEGDAASLAPDVGDYSSFSHYDGGGAASPPTDFSDFASGGDSSAGLMVPTVPNPGDAGNDYGNAASADYAPWRGEMASGGTFRQDHTHVYGGNPGEPRRVRGPRTFGFGGGGTPIERAIVEFLNTLAPAETMLPGGTVADTIVLLSTAFEHRANFVQTAQGQIDQRDFAAGGINVADLKVPILAAGEIWTGPIHSHPGLQSVALSQSREDIDTADRFARTQPGRVTVLQSSYVVGASGYGPYFGVVRFDPLRGRPHGTLTTLTYEPPP